jgi:hypothetical protein
MRILLDKTVRGHKVSHVGQIELIDLPSDMTSSPGQLPLELSDKLKIPPDKMSSVPASRQIQKPLNLRVIRRE